MATADTGGESIVRTDPLDHFSSTELRTASSYTDQFGEEADLSVWMNCRHVFAVWPTRTIWTNGKSPKSVICIHQVLLESSKIIKDDTKLYLFALIMETQMTVEQPIPK